MRGQFIEVFFPPFSAVLRRPPPPAITPVSLPTFITTDQLAPESSQTLGEGGAHHMRVLRLRAGERARLPGGEGVRGMETVIRIAKRNALVQVDGCEFTEPLP